MIQNLAELFILKVDAVATGTQLRVGRGENEFCPVESLAIGDEIFDPTEDRMVEITEVACVTLDRDTVRDRGFSTRVLAGDTSRNPLIYGVKLAVPLARSTHPAPVRSEYRLPEGVVFYALGFERRAIVETPSCLCEFGRPSQYKIQISPQLSVSIHRSNNLRRHD